MPRDRVIFYLNGQHIEVTGDDVFLTLADYLRKRRSLTGTKIVCAEGDCGSCTVLVGRPLPGQLNYVAITSCIQILFQLDASHVVTVEGLREGNELNPIQQAMVACHGTQCGFCTPGFVVAMHGLMAGGNPIDTESMRRGLTGNLCRCTGYDSILKAAVAVDQAQIKTLQTLYPSPQMPAVLAEAEHSAVLIETPSRKFFKPVSITDAVKFRFENPDCAVIAGGTDLGVVYNKRIRPITVAMSLAGINSQRQASVDESAMHIGAGCTLTTFKSMAVGSLPELGRFMDWFGSPLIRNAGTLGGNLVTGSPIGDTIPAMIVLGCTVEIAGVTANRRVPIEQFFTGYRQTVLAAGELVTAVHIPLLKRSHLLKLYKVSRRKDLDISSFSAAIWMQQSAGIIEDVRIAFGGVGPMVMRMSQTEAIIRGQSPTRELFERAGAVARLEVKPISDVRGGAEYRKTLAANILMKFWFEALSQETADDHPAIRSE